VGGLQSTALQVVGPISAPAEVQHLALYAVVGYG